MLTYPMDMDSADWAEFLEKGWFLEEKIISHSFRAPISDPFFSSQLQ